MNIGTSISDGNWLDALTGLAAAPQTVVQGLETV
jgi:hypothetical protein